MSRKFYVNQVHGEDLLNGIPYPQMVIGLFDQCETEGRGNFCGYYGSEYYLNTKLYAYYVAEGGLYQPEKRISDVMKPVSPFIYDEVQIGSHMWTYVIEAETVEEAIVKFTNAEWRRWTYPEDEF